ncbi:MAG: leishmanolysin-related zinc metalloendopeptidase [Gemmatimonadota bacterium]|nr:leishmanolysin-related zinc metalloendopeptidase [Gemmatimonadota bacterium]
MFSRRVPQAVRGVAVVAVAALAACRGDSTAPPKPVSVEPAASVAITGTVGAALTPAPQFVVRDASGNAISGVAVTIVVASGGGTLTNPPAKTSSGGTSVGTWTLGTTAGANSLTVTVNGLPPLTITATGTPDVASKIVIASGDAQSAPAAAALTSPVAFKVADKYNNGIANQAVTFSVIGGNGTLGGSASGTTDATGVAVAPAWTLGKSTDGQLLRAISGAFSVTATATVATNFSMSVRFFGPAIDPTIQDAFTTAARRIQGLITGALSPVQLTAFDISSCGTTGVAPLTETVTGVIVYAQVGPIDGPGGILGSAGPCYIRVSSGLSLIGVMNFDVADLQTLASTNRLNSVILHEMLHTLGFGTLWASKALTTGAGTPSSAFIGAQAIAGCQFHGGGANCATSIPLETTGGAGTRDVHWREVSTATGIGFDTELMTGFAEAPGIPMPLSRMTIGSMADLGYVVNLLPYDAYTVPSSVAAALSRIREAQGLEETMLTDRVREPIAAVDAGGRVRPLPVPR